MDTHVPQRRGDRHRCSAILWNICAASGIVASMSSVSLPSGDDPPDAAGKHLDDAQTLFVHNRWDGAAYLAGYVAECSLKSVILVGNLGTPDWPKSAAGHDLAVLEGKALGWLGAAAFSGRAAKYQPAVTAAATLRAGWQVGLRYRPAGHVTEADAAAYIREAEDLYVATVVEMRKDGLL